MLKSVAQNTGKNDPSLCEGAVILLARRKFTKALGTLEEDLVADCEELVGLQGPCLAPAPPLAHRPRK